MKPSPPSTRIRLSLGFNRFNCGLLALCLLAASLPLDLWAQAPITNAVRVVEVVSWQRTNLYFIVSASCGLDLNWADPNNGTVSPLSKSGDSFNLSYQANPGYSGDDYFVVRAD